MGLAPQKNGILFLVILGAVFGFLAFATIVTLVAAIVDIVSSF